MLPTIYYGIVQIPPHLRIHSYMKKSSTFPSIAPILALEPHVGRVYLSLFHGFYRLLKLLYAPFFFFFACVTQCIEHTEQPMDDADEIYNKNLELVLDFFASKLHLYYSSSRLTLLLTFLSTRKPDYLRTDNIPLPSRLKITDDDALGLHSAGSYYYPAVCYWQIFQDFLDSNHPLALDEQKYTIAALACLKILFGHHQAPVSRMTWFNQHSRALRVRMGGHPQRPHKDLAVGTYWGRSLAFYWHLRTYVRNQRPQKQPLWTRSFQFGRESADQNSRSNHLLFLLQRSAYSDKILTFARYRVFRFRYLHRKHPKYMKKAIFSLAKYIQRVTGETAEVRACESIWGRHNRVSFHDGYIPRSVCVRGGSLPH